MAFLQFFGVITTFLKLTRCPWCLVTRRRDSRSFSTSFRLRSKQTAAASKSRSSTFLSGKTCFSAALVRLMRRWRDYGVFVASLASLPYSIFESSLFRFPTLDYFRAEENFCYPFSIISRPAAFKFITRRVMNSLVSIRCTFFEPGHMLCRWLCR